MMKLKKAFTVVELIFVIMIIGILALVAIPRLAATTDDAKISINLNHLGTIINDFSAYYTTYDHFSGNIDNMTNIKEINYTTPWNNSTQKGTLTYYTLDEQNNLESCIRIFLSNSEGNMTLESIISPHGTICKDLQNIPTYLNYVGEKLFGGNRVKF